MSSPGGPVGKVMHRPVPRESNEKLRLGRRTRSFADVYEKKPKLDWLPHPDQLEWPVSLSDNHEESPKNVVRRRKSLKIVINYRNGNRGASRLYKVVPMESVLCDHSPYFRDLVELKGITS